MLGGMKMGGQIFILCIALNIFGIFRIPLMQSHLSVLIFAA
jgi:hypothetical protein